MTRKVLRGGSLFDGSGSAPEPGDVAVERERIVAVGVDLDGDEEIDCSGRTLLPGLIDCHVHVTISHLDIGRHLNSPYSLHLYEAVRNLSTTLRAGITTARDAFGADAGLRTALETRLFPGPRLLVAIGILSQVGGHGDAWCPAGGTAPLPFLLPHPGRPGTVVTGPDEVRRKVRELLRAGADVIKVATSGGVMSPLTQLGHAHFRPDELESLVAEATAADRFVMAHAISTEGIKNAVRAGVRSIEHGFFLDEEAIDLMKERGTWLVPTLLAVDGVTRAAETGDAIPQGAAAKIQEIAETHRASFETAVAAGVKVAMGTDCPVSPHGTNLTELELMERWGKMSPEQVLVAATSSAAALLGRADEIGTIERGKLADFVIIEGGLNLTTLADRVVSVWQGGVEVVGRRDPGSEVEQSH